jgi:hypothetical protein
MQRLVGNAATARAIAPVQRQVAAPPAAGLTPAQQAQLLRAGTTLREVPRLAADQRALLSRAIPAAPMYQAIQERDTKRSRLAQRTDELRLMRDQQAHPPEHGAPPNDTMVEEVARDVDRLTTDVDRLDERVRSGLATLGVSTEGELAQLVTERFPQLFLERGKQIALTELRQNRKIVEKEVNRYGLDMCIDPAARNALLAAARDLVGRDDRIGWLNRRIAELRANVEVPGGADPVAPASVYRELATLQDELRAAGPQRDQVYRQYALAHPVLFRDVDLRALASGDTAQFDKAVGDELRTVAENIDKTIKEVEDGSRLKVWSMPRILDLTAQDLGVAGNEVLMEAVRKRMQADKLDDALLKIATAALGITAGIIATVASGGVALVAGAASVGIAAYQASESVKDFLAAHAASNVALNSDVAQLTKDEPDLFWLVLDLVSVGLEAGALVRAFGEVKNAARAAAEAGELAELASAASRVMSPSQAEQLTDKVGRMSAARAADEEAAAIQGGRVSAGIRTTEVAKSGAEVVEEGVLRLSREEREFLRDKWLAEAAGATDAAKRARYEQYARTAEQGGMPASGRVSEQEIQWLHELAGAGSQGSYRGGNPVSGGTKGSVRPDVQLGTWHVETKRYILGRQGGKGEDDLVRDLYGQFAKRLEHLPYDTRFQGIVVDLRGQGVSSADLQRLRHRIHDEVVRRAYHEALSAGRWYVTPNTQAPGIETITVVAEGAP